MRKFLLFTIVAAVVALTATTVYAAPPPDGPPGLERAIAAQEAHTRALLAKPDVVGTAVGYNAAGEAAVIVFTARPGAPDLPGKLEGVPVEVRVTGKFYAFAPPPTVASFDYTCSGGTCDFDGSSSTGRGRFISAEWDFGDGDTGSGLTVTHPYATEDTYSVKLTVTFAVSGTDSVIRIVNLAGGTNSPPVADITRPAGDSCAESGTTVLFEGSATDLEDGNLTDSLVWTSNIDGTIGTGGSFSTTLSDGSHTITTSVTDSGSATHSDTVGIIVGGAVDTTARFVRPVPIGVSTGHPNITAGTIGARVTDGTDFYALSNNHVYADENLASIGDVVLQPGTFDGGEVPIDQIGTLYDFETIVFNDITASNQMDAAIALSSADKLGKSTPSGGYGTPSSAIVSPSIGMSVQKYGRTTKLTTGTVSETNVIVNVCYEDFGGQCTKWARFVGQIAIGSGGFSAGGDSGSLIVTNDGNKNPVGLLFAGSNTRTIASPIGPVLDRFGVSVDGAATSDTTAPIISGVASGDITDTSAHISWTTDEASNSVVNYGTSIALGATASVADLVTNHLVPLSGLAAETGYYYEVQSSDSSGNTATDNNDGSYYTFTTAPASAGVSVTSIEPNNVLNVDATFSVTIKGSGFLAGAQVTFENGNGPAPKASNIVVDDPNTITAMVTMKSGGPPRVRYWDVRVTNPDSTSGVLEDGFGVIP